MAVGAALSLLLLNCCSASAPAAIGSATARRPANTSRARALAGRVTSGSSRGAGVGRQLHQQARDAVAVELLDPQAHVAG